MRSLLLYAIAVALAVWVVSQALEPNVEALGLRILGLAEEVE